jgi:hypothetical protein
MAWAAHVLCRTSPDFNGGTAHFGYADLSFRTSSIPVFRRWIAGIPRLTVRLGMIIIQHALRNTKQASRPTPFDQYKNKQAERYKTCCKFTRTFNSVVNIVINFRSARLLFTRGIRPTFTNKPKGRRKNLYISQPNKLL